MADVKQRKQNILNNEPITLTIVHKTKKTYKLYYTRDDPHSRPDRTASEAETIK